MTRHGARTGPLDAAGEALLVDRCKAGDDEAWAQVYAIFGAPMGAFLRRSAGRDADVEDLVQQVFVECFSSIHRYRGDASLRTWLYGIAANIASKANRSAFRRRRRAEAFGDHERVVGERHAADPARRVEARREMERLQRVLERLPTKYRLVWVMVELEQLTGAEVATALGVRPGTVRARLCKARRQVLAGLESARRGAHGKAAAPMADAPEVMRT